MVEPVVDPVGVPRAELLASVRVTVASRSASSAGEPANADGDMYGEPVIPSGGPSGSTCHQRCPAAASQSTKRYASLVEDPVRQRGRMEQDSGGACEVHAFRAVTTRESRQMPLPKTTQPPARIQIQAIEPIVDCGRYPVKRTVGDHVDVYATIFKDGHDMLGGCGPGARPGRAAGARCRCSRSATTAGAARSPSTVRAAGSSPSPRGPTGSRPGRTRSAARSKRADRARRRARPRARCCSAAVASPSRRRSPPRRATATARSTSSPLEVDVDRVLARFGAWYELFPRSWGGFRGVAEVLPQLAELGFDVVYLPPIHPIGVHEPQGPNNALDARAGRRRLAVGDRRGGGRSRRDPSGPRHVGRLRRAGRRGEGRRRRDRARLRDPVLARPPVAEASIPSGSTAAPTAR